MSLFSFQKNVEPENAAEFSEIFKEAENSRLSVIPCGSGTHQTMGHFPARTDLAVFSRKFNRVLEHSENDLTITVESGMTLGKLQEFLLPHGQFFPFFSPGCELRTIGGILSTGSHNLLSLAYGAVRELVLGLTVCHSNGVVTKSGGKVVKNVSGYEMPKLYIGSLGTLAYLLTCTLRLAPLPEQTIFLKGSAPNPEICFNAIDKLFKSKLLMTGAFLRCSLKQQLVLVVISGKKKFTALQALKVKKMLDENGLQETGEISRTEGETLTKVEKTEILCSGFFPPASLLDLYSYLRSFSDEQKLEGDFLFSFQGFFRTGWEGNLDNSIPEKFTGLDLFVFQNGGWNVYEKVKPDYWRSWEMWGKERPEWKMSLRLKKSLDPEGILNPGRFVLRG